MPISIIHLKRVGKKQSETKCSKIAGQKKCLEELIGIFGIPQNCIYAVGRTAEKQLGYIKVAYIRHPSYGGKNDCMNEWNICDSVMNEDRFGENA